MKVCSRCQLELSNDLFYDSNPWTCSPCVKARAAIRYKEKREECLAYAKQWAAENPERSREIKKDWRERNKATVHDYAQYRRALFPEAIAAANEKYRQAHPELYAAATARRRAAVLNAMPEWADLEAIDLFYEFAQLLTEATEELYEVDHVIPLQGELVSGLHVETNLRVITRNVNRVKSNKYEESENG